MPDYVQMLLRGVYGTMENQEIASILPDFASRGLPSYIQVAEAIKRDIISGVLSENQKLDSIKVLAERYGVNSNTVQRALSTLEKQGLVVSHRTAGKYVTENKLLIRSIRNREARRVTEDFVSQLEILKIKPDELVQLFVNPFDTDIK